MARGKQLDNQTIYYIMTLYAVKNNIRAVAQEMKLPISTVQTIIEKNRDKPEFVQLRTQKKKEFSDKCTELLDVLLDAAKIKADAFLKNKRTLNRVKLTEITTAIGTLYDKRALAQGESTDHVTFSIPDEVRKYAE